MRAGAVVTATTAEPVSRERCRGGWYMLEGGGYVCNVADVIAFDGEKLPEVRGAQPNPETALPYQFGYAKRDRVPVFRRLPTIEELRAAEDPAVLAAVMRGPPEDSDGGVVEGDSTGDSGSGDSEASAADTASETSEEEGAPTLSSLQGHEASPVLRVLMKGFYVSLDREFDVPPRKVWRTLHNEFIPSEALALVTGSEFEGAVLDETTTLPLGFVLSSDTCAYVPNEKGALKCAEKPGYHFRFHVASREGEGKKAYVVDDAGRRFAERDVTVLELRKRPKKVAEDESWIDVDLERQSLVAYEGDRPVYATLISSGRVRRGDPKKEHATPAGVYRLLSKHVSHVMDGDNAIDGPYSIEDVPYVMYFQGAFALHTAFWHNRFGRPKSHGCVNLAPKDAKWLFGWTDPKLPASWHGVYPDAKKAGTWVFVRGEAPVL
ncbi:MAG: L,D-transpeptidase [Polyangiales bacterium]